MLGLVSAQLRESAMARPLLYNGYEPSGDLCSIPRGVADLRVQPQLVPWRRWPMNGLKRLLVLLGVAGCAGTSSPREGERVGEVKQAVVVAPTALPNNFTLRSRWDFENMLKVTPPSTRPAANCPNGRWALQMGEPSREIAARRLFDSAGMIDTIGQVFTTTTNNFNVAPFNAPSTPGTDNHLVRLRDGSLLGLRLGDVWKTIPGSPFANEVVGPSNQPGNRGGWFFYRSTDCGSTWSPWSLVDMATLNGGKYGWPRPLDAKGNFSTCANQFTDPSGKRSWWVGQGDRPEIYVCPFTGNVYLTMHIAAGPYCPSGPTAGAFDSLALLTSIDNGLSWSVNTDALPVPSSSPVVMTSTPNGRLFLFGIEGAGVPTVRFSQAMQAGQQPALGAAFAAHYKQGSTALPAGVSIARRSMMILSDRNAGLAINASGGARAGGPLKLAAGCTKDNPDCTWSYLNGMLLSDRDPGLAIVPGTPAPGDTQKVPLTLQTQCTIAQAQCTWTYKDGQFFSDQSPTKSINAWGGGVDGAPIVITQLCNSSEIDCTWTLPSIMFRSDTNRNLSVIASNAAHGTILTLSDLCSPANPDCTFTFKKGMITSDKNPALGVNARFGAAHLNKIQLFNNCPATAPECRWRWSKGQIISEGAGATLPINAFGGAAPGTELWLHSGCNATLTDCTFGTLVEPVDLDRRYMNAPSLSRVSTDTSSSKVRLAYSVRNADNMLDLAVVNFDAASPGSPTSLALFGGSRTHSAMFPVFIEPDYLEMPKDDRANTSMLYWVEAPSVANPAASHTYTAKYVMIDGDNLTSPAALSVSGGASRTWSSMNPKGLGDYMTGGFFWRHKTLNYLPQWVETASVVANVVTVKSPRPGFVIRSDRNAGLLFNAFGGAVQGGPLKLMAGCSSSNPDCTWSYHNGMIVSDRDPNLALRVANALEGQEVRLSNSCTPSNANCTWTYQRGMFLSDADLSLALKAQGATESGRPIVLARGCGHVVSDCTWTLPSVEITSAMDTRLAMKVAPIHNTLVKLSDQCTTNDVDCTFTFSHGTITHGSNSALMLNAVGAGGQNLADVKLMGIGVCNEQNAQCRWTWKKGQLISDGSLTGTLLPINSFGGSVPNAPLKVNSACTAAHNDCVFAGYYAR